MAGRLIWSPQALDDIEGIAEYIARDSEFYAAVVAQRLFEAAEPLTTFPQSGRIVPEVNNPKIRELFVHDYRLMYEIDGEEIHVLTVVHGKRNFDPELLKPPE